MIVSDLLGSIDGFRGAINTVMFTTFDLDMGCPIMLDKYLVDDIMTSSKYTNYRISKVISWYTFYDDDNADYILIVQI